MEEKYEIMKIETHKFERSKNNLKEFSEQTKTYLELNKVRTNGNFLDILSKGLFGINNHSVTGKELNELTSQIQEHLIKINDTQVKVIKEFGEVYNTFESLDRDYMNKICLSIRGLEEINRKISKNIEDIEKLLNNQKLTLEAILKFKKEVENYGIEEIKREVLKNGNDIERILDSQKNTTNIVLELKYRTEEKFSSIDKIKNEFNEKLSAQEKVLSEITEFKNKMENYKIDEDSEIKLKNLKKFFIISSIFYGIIMIILFLLFFIGSK